MRVVGGKTGTDGRLFAYLVWTVPGGPAEKMGLQQGDKVCGVYIYISYLSFVFANSIQFNLVFAMYISLLQ